MSVSTKWTDSCASSSSLLLLGTFVAQGTRINPIHAAFPGDGMRSKEIRSKPQRKLLDLRMQGVVYVIRLVVSRDDLAACSSKGNS